PSRHQFQADRNPLWLHPLAEMTAGMADSCQRSPDLGEPALMRRAIAEIRRDYLGDPSRIFLDRLFELGQVRAPSFERGRSVAKKRLALAGKDRAEIACAIRLREVLYSCGGHGRDYRSFPIRKRDLT